MSKSTKKKSAPKPKKTAKAKAAKPKPAAALDVLDAKPGVPAIVAHGDLTPSPLNPRKHFDEEKIAEIGASIVEKGLLQPLTVRPGKKAGAYEIVIGETRWRAIGAQIKAKELPAAFPINVIVKELADKEVVEIGLIENLQRKNLTALEEARGFAELRARGDTTDDIAAHTGISRRTVQSRLTLVDRCAPQVLKALEAGNINPTQARTLAMASHKKQRELLAQIDDANWTEEDLLGAVTGDMPGTHLAFFPLDRYTGDIVTEEGTDRQYFADEAEYLKLQEEAIHEKKAEWEAQGKTVLIIRNDKGQWFHSFDWTRKPKDKRAVTVMEITRGLEVKVHTGMVPKRDQEDEGASTTEHSDDQLDLEEAIGGGASRQARVEDSAESEKASDAFTRAHRSHANRRKTCVLQEAVAADSGMAMRLVCARLLDQYGFGLLLISPGADPVDSRGWVSERVLETVQRCLETFPPETQHAWNQNLPLAAGEESTDRGIWRALCALSEGEVAVLFAALVATRTGIWGDTIGVDEVEQDIAASLGVAGQEVSHGLTLGAAPHGPSDLDGLRKSALVGIRRKLGADEPGKDAVDAIRDNIMGQDRSHFVLPTLAFLTPEETAAALNDLMAAR